MGKGEFVLELFCIEETAIREALRVFQSGSMQKVVVVDESLSIVFKNTRRCHCTNIQREIDGKEYCMECRIEINHRGWMSADELAEVGNDGGGDTSLGTDRGVEDGDEIEQGGKPSGNQPQESLHEGVSI